MVDEKKFIIKLQELLIAYGYEQYAELLDGASCEFYYWGSYEDYWTLYLNLAPKSFRVVDEDDDVRQKLILYSQKAVPKQEITNLQVEISLNYNDEVNSSTLERQLFNPSFGKPSTDEKYQCDVFVIMPFKPELKPVYDNIIKPVIENMGYTIKRADELYTDKESMHKIWSMFHACQLVIADCTEHNPNVFYELGIAHTIGKPTVMITQNQDLPFDIRTKDALLYSTNFDKTENFKNKLKKAIQDMIGHKPVIDEIPF